MENYYWITWKVEKKKALRGEGAHVVLSLENKAARRKGTYHLEPGQDLAAFWRGPGCNVPQGAILATEKAIDELNKVKITGG